MKRTSLIVTIIVLVSLLFVGLRFIPDARATILYVGGGGPDNYTTIQAAIDDANHGDTVFVYTGLYSEHITISETLSLIGEDRDATIIEGFGFGVVVSVTADWVNITGFTIRGGTEPIVSTIGIKLFLVQNCFVANNSASKNWAGINLVHSNNNTVENNSLSTNEAGISVEYSSSNVIANNDISSSHMESIRLFYSSSNTLASNAMMEGGIYVRGELLEHWNTHSIDTSNTVNGKPVHYWKDIIGGTIPSDAGQVILANCTAVAVENQFISNSSEGIQLGFSSNNAILNNTVSNNWDGIFLYSSNNNSLENNTISDNSEGVHLSYSDGNSLTNNSASSNYNGVNLRYSSNNTFQNNTASSNIGDGVYLYLSTNNTFVGGVVSDNRDGIMLQTYSDSNTITNNTLLNNRDRGLYL